MSDPHPARERELAQDSVKAVGQILSNYQAALHLFEEAVGGSASVPPQLTRALLQQAARDVFAPVLDACAGVAPGLDDLVTESMAAAAAPAPAVLDLVVAERERVAVTHSRLIRRQPRLIEAAGESAAVAAAARRLDDLQIGSHSAGALFNLLFERWSDLQRGR